MIRINYNFKKLLHKILMRLAQLRIRNYFKLQNTVKELQSKISQQDKRIKTLKSSIDTIKHQDIEIIKKNIKSLILNQMSAAPILKNLKNKYKDQTCFLLGAGKSLDQLDPKLINDNYIMSVNGAIFKEDLDSNFFCSVSYNWYLNFIDELSNLKVDNMFLPHYIYHEIDHDKKVLFNCIEHYHNLGLPNPLYFSTDTSKNIPLGGTVIGVSLQILFYLGFKEVILLGVDHDYDLDESQRIEGGVVLNSSNFNHLNIDYYKKEQNVHIDILAMERSYLLAKHAFEENGRKILNATPDTKLDIFEKINLLDYLSKKMF